MNKIEKQVLVDIYDTCLGFNEEENEKFYNDMVKYINSEPKLKDKKEYYIQQFTEKRDSYINDKEPFIKQLEEYILEFNFSKEYLTLVALWVYENASSLSAFFDVLDSLCYKGIFDLEKCIDFLKNTSPSQILEIKNKMYNKQ